MPKIIIHGYKGRMGRALLACAERLPQVQISGRVDLGDDISRFIEETDVVVDFSFHEATEPLARLCAAHRKALVIGTTGHSDSQKQGIVAHASLIPIVWSSNYSTGVNLLFWLTRKTAQIAGPDFDVEIVEMHHRTKKDAPSGTAATLAEIVAGAQGAQTPDVLRHGRQGITGERSRREIGMHSLRGGDVVGDHTVVFAGTGERIELTHRAASRDTFAQGALRAACWAAGQKPGLYSMLDVLGLS